MKLQNKELGYIWEIEVSRGEFGCVDMRVKSEDSEALIHLAQVDALSLAKVLEEQVKENRRH